MCMSEQRTEQRSRPAGSVSRRRGPSLEQSTSVSEGELAYAVCAARAPVPANLSASCSGRCGRRIVTEGVSDELLLKQVAAGNKAAMHIMFARHRKTVFGFVQRIVRNPAIADDLVSQVFLDVWRSAHKFEGRAKVSTWFLSIARFKALSSLRERRCETIDQNEVLAIADVSDTPERAVARKQASSILQMSIDTLSAAHQQVIELIYFQDKSVAEVSEILGISDSTVKTRMFYARKRLANLIVNARGCPAEERDASSDRGALISIPMKPSVNSRKSHADIFRPRDVAMAQYT